MKNSKEKLIKILVSKIKTISQLIERIDCGEGNFILLQNLIHQLEGLIYELDALSLSLQPEKRSMKRFRKGEKGNRHEKRS